MIARDSKILFCCSGGKVRSVAGKYLAEDLLGCTNALAVGLRKAHPDTLAFLFRWADWVVVVGEKKLTKLVPADWEGKVVHADVGRDEYGVYSHPRLLRRLTPMLKGLIDD